MTETTETPVALGDYVETTNGSGYRGRVTETHVACPEDAAWLRGQQLLGPNPVQYKNTRWVSILVHRGGAITVPDAFARKVEPFDLDNSWSDHYWPKATA